MADAALSITQTSKQKALLGGHHHFPYIYFSAPIRKKNGALEKT